MGNGSDEEQARLDRAEIIEERFQSIFESEQDRAAKQRKTLKDLRTEYEALASVKDNLVDTAALEAKQCLV